MATTMWDVAKELNLSQTTVSKALSGKGSLDIPEETRRRVRDTARSMGYRPNHLARALSSRRSYLISLMVSNLHPAFYSRSVAAFEDALHDSEYDLQIRKTLGWTPERWREAAVDRWPLDGVIVFEASYGIPHMLKNGKGIPPLVSVGSMYHTEVDHVGIDLRTGSLEAIRHLLESGRTRIGYLTTDTANAEDQRVVTYEEEMRRIDAAPRHCGQLPQGHTARASSPGRP